MDKQEATMTIIEGAKIKARKTLLDFTRWTMPHFEDTWFHKSFFNQLQDFAEGKVKKMMVWIPPQCGKTEAATRRMSAYLLGLDPTLKIAIVSYSASMARKFNREIQRIIDGEEYREIFPDTMLNQKNVVSVAGSWLRNADECETMKHGGGFKTVGVGGSLTGNKVDILIIDDVYKDAQDAWSNTVRSNISDWYDTVAETRLHNDSKQLIVFTRWHQDDIAGRILRQSDDWKVIKYEAIKTGEPNEIDPRQKGEVLWKERHSLEKLLKSKQNNPYAFESLYQQNPSPKGGNFIKGEWFNIVGDEAIPNLRLDLWVDGAYTKSTNNDPTGLMVAGKYNNKLYILDFKEAYMEMPEALTLIVNICNVYDIDMGSRIFIEPKASGKSMVQMLRQKGLNAVEITSKLVSEGKEARIHTSAPLVNAGGVILREGKWNDVFIHELESFPGAKHDEAVDLLGYAIDHYMINREYKTVNEFDNSRRL